MNRLKNLFAILLLGISTPLFCQISATIETQHPTLPDINHVLEHIDLNYCSSGLMLEASAVGYDLDPYNGTSLDTNNIVDIDAFGMVYATLYGAVINIADTLPHPGQAYILDYEAQSSTPAYISAVLFDFESLDTNAVNDGRLSVVNDQLIHGLPISPFASKTCFAAFSTTTSVPQLNAIFKLESSKLQTNINDSLVFSIDFGEGQGYQSFSIDNDILYSFGSIGQKDIKVKVVVDGSNTYLSHFIVEVVSSTSFDDRDKNNDRYNPDLETPNIEYQANGANALMYGVCDDAVIRKPFIYVEGFNPPLLIEQGKEHLDVQLTNESFNGFNNRLIDHLEANGYDIIYVDWDDSTRPIQDNAATLEEIIIEVNRLKASNGSIEPTLIFGESMGGLVAKYCLLDMERRNVTHDVSKLMTFDSPLRGANIPLSVQLLSNHISNKRVSNLGGVIGNMPLKLFVPPLKDADETLHSPAAKQMLYYHEDQIIGNSSGEYHDAFYQELSNLGSPTNFEMFAISNGSQIGEGNEYIDQSDKLISIHGLSTFVIIDAIKFLNTDTWVEALVLEATRLFPRVGYVDLDLFSVPSLGNSNTLYSFITVSNVLTIPIFNNYRKVNITGTHDYDTGPGGLSPLADVRTGGNVEIFTNSFNFVPTVSALDMPGITIDPYTTIPNALPNDVVDFRASIDNTFRSYGINMHNQEHVEFTPRNSQFFVETLLDQVIGNDNRINTVAGGLVDDRRYNFGSGFFGSTTIRRVTDNYINQDLTITNTGGLNINENSRIGFSDINSNTIASTPSSFDVYVKNSCTNPITIIENFGLIKVGDEINNNEGRLIFIDNSAMINSGTIEIEDQSSIIIKEGSTLTLKAGSNLTLKSSSDLIIELGGTLLIEQGANILLEQPIASVSLAGSGSNIRIHGTLLLDGGEIEVDGDGYVWMDFGSNIEVDNASFVTFSSEDDTNISYLIDQFNYPDGKGLKIEDANFYIRSGNLTVSNSNIITEVKNSIITGRGGENQGNFICNNTNFHIRDSKFYDATFMPNSSIGFIIGTEMTITNKPSCVVADACDQIVARGSDFKVVPPIYNLTNIDYLGIKLNGTKHLIADHCTFNDFKSFTTVTPKFGDYKSAAIASTTPTIIHLEATYIDNSNDGVQNLDKGVALKMVSSFISNCENAININTQQIGESLDEPSILEMLCSGLMDNTTGVYGVNILLSIDGEINAQSTDGELRPNVFENNSLDFEIYYQQLEPVNNLQARYNKWTSFNNYYLSYKNQQLTLDQGNNVTNTPTCAVWFTDPNDPTECNYATQSFPLYSSTIGLVSGSNFCFGDTPCGSTITIQQMYWEGYRAISEEKIDCAMTRYSKVARERFSSDYDLYGDNCKHQIAIAAAYVKINNTQNGISNQAKIEIEEVCVTEIEQGTVPDSYVFLFDASASIHVFEFNQMRHTARLILDAYDTLGINVEYSVIQFSGTNEQVVSIPFTSDINLMYNLPRAFNGGTNVSEGVLYAENYININNKSSRLLIFSDATKSLVSNLLSITNNMKPDRDITFVRYQNSGVDESADNAFYAASASKGGSYIGTIEANPGDPQGEGAPRKFIMGSFTMPYIEIVNQVISVTTCDYLTITNNEFCADGVINWYASEGGNILTDSTDVASIRTNNVGTYTVTIQCPTGCEYVNTYEYRDTSSNPLARIIVQGGYTQSDFMHLDDRSDVDASGMLKQPHDRERDILSRTIDNNWIEEITLSPNPTDGLLHLQKVEGHIIYTVIDINGRTLLNGDNTKSNSIDVSSLNTGMYQLIIYSEERQVIYQFIKVD